MIAQTNFVDIITIMVVIPPEEIALKPGQKYPLQKRGKKRVMKQEKICQ